MKKPAPFRVLLLASTLAGATVTLATPLFAQRGWTDGPSSSTLPAPALRPEGAEQDQLDQDGI